MDFRTDLAVERVELGASADAEGIEKKVYECGGAEITSVRVLGENGERLIGKPAGNYITVEVPSFTCENEMLDGRLNALIGEIKKLIPDDSSVLVAGLGNRNLTADALGPLCADKIFVTRHIGKELSKALGLGSLRSVASVAAGVLGSTGMESFEIISGIVKKCGIGCVIAIDALAAMDIARLGTTVQLSDTGISPGSGIGNRRTEISEKTLGVPVIAIGVPTVISAYSLAASIIEKSGQNSDLSEAADFKEYIVASREADLLVSSAADFIALAVNAALQPNVDIAELMMLTN